MIDIKNNLRQHLKHVLFVDVREKTLEIAEQYVKLVTPSEKIDKNRINQLTDYMQDFVENEYHFNLIAAVLSNNFDEAKNILISFFEQKAQEEIKEIEEYAEYSNEHDENEVEARAYESREMRSIIRSRS